MYAAMLKRLVGDRRYLVRLNTEDGHKAVHAIFDDCDSVAREMLTGVGVGFVTFKPASAPICANYAFYQMRPPRAARRRRPHLFRGDAQTKTHLTEADRTDLLGTRVVWPVVLGSWSVCQFSCIWAKCPEYTNIGYMFPSRTLHYALYNFLTSRTVGGVTRLGVGA